MAKYIDKDALVAEIERRLWLLVPTMTFRQQRVELEKLLSFIDTLEVKEVDLEKEILNYIGDEASCKHGKWTWYECNKMIRHFFELGLKAQKGE